MAKTPKSPKNLENSSAPGLEINESLKNLGSGGKLLATGLEAAIAPAAALTSNLGSLGAALDKLPSKIPVIGKIAGPFYGLFKELTGGAEGLGKALEDVVSQTTVFNTYLLKTRGVFDSNSDAAKRLINDIVGLQKANADLGVRSRDITKLTGELSTALSVRLGDSFDETLGSVTRTVGAMDRLGVSTATSVAGFADLNILFDSSPAKFNLFARQVADFSRATRQDFSTVFVEAQKNLDSFAEGLTSEETLAKFLRFQAVSKQTGIEVNQLKSTFDKFDTIEGAQETGGQLAAVFRQFGVDFNATEFAFLTQDEQQQVLTEKLQDFLPRIQGVGQRSRRLILKQLGSTIGLSPAQLTRLSRGEGVSVSPTPTAISQQEFETAARRQLAADPARLAGAGGEAVTNAITQAVLEPLGKTMGDVSQAASDFMTVFKKDNIDKIAGFFSALSEGTMTVNEFKAAASKLVEN